MSRNACNGENGENGETGEKSPASGDLNWMPKVAPRKLAILAILAKKEKNERETLVIVKASFSQELNHAFRNRF